MSTSISSSDHPIPSESSAFRWEVIPPEILGKNKVGKVIFDLPNEKVNKFNQKVMADFDALLRELEFIGKPNRLEALILVSRKPGNFIAGADLEWIQSARRPEEAEALSQQGQELLNRWEDLPFPTVVAVDGAALGGGCELSLASSAILMSNHPQARIGLPEVLLGFIPGMGGCIRLPRKIGLTAALDLILSGKIISGEKAFQLGLVEACLPLQNFEESVIRWVLKHLSSLQTGERLARTPRLGQVGGLLGKVLESPMGRPYLFKKAKKEVWARTRGQYPAPLEVFSVFEKTGVELGPKWRGEERKKALKIESEAFGQLAVTDISKNLVRLFFLTEKMKKENGLSKPLSKGTDASEVKEAAVLGAGVMGGGIAQLFAEKSIPIRMKDLNLKALGLGIKQASVLFEKQRKRKKISSREFFQKLNCISPQLDDAGFHRLDLVIEAVVENLEVKKKVLQQLEEKVSEKNCFIASNTSSLSITEMQKALKHPERFVGMHFFNPVSKMPLIEVIRGEKTSDEAVEAIFQLSKKLGKTPVVVKDSPGFLVNRLLMPYLNEAAYLVQEGCSIEELDQALLSFGMPMGPLELIDEVGVDVGDKVSHILFEGFGERMAPCTLHQKLIDAGRLGKKTGKGFYEYSGQDKKFNSDVYQLFAVGVKDSSVLISKDQWIERCIFSMINEASRCLEEAVVKNPGEVDLGMLMGTGFPAFRGGLLRYADSRGLSLIIDRLKFYEKTVGPRFQPSSALIKRAEAKQSFYSS